eukprot:scaffold25495_cov30-Tisochrysis_lutea.AAC.9
MHPSAHLSSIGKPRLITRFHPSWSQLLASCPVAVVPTKHCSHNSLHSNKQSQRTKNSLAATSVADGRGWSIASWVELKRIGGKRE